MELVLDIETKRFTPAFQRAKREDQRRRLAPKPLLACIYLIQARRYRFFTPSTLPQLLEMLDSAERIITFNGDRFDFLVLERWCGWRRSQDFAGKSVDLCRIIAAKPFTMVGKPRVKGGTLDRAGKLNFGIARKSGGTLREQCRAHVRLTYLLYQRWTADELMYPVRPEANLPETCPECGRTVELVPFQPDYTGMTDGQIFDYELGHQVGGWGFARCTGARCRKFFVWGI